MDHPAEEQALAGGQGPIQMKYSQIIGGGLVF
jgi:hypothetical protein